MLAPFLTDLFNKSLSTGTLPSIFKSAYITPRLKKPDLDTAEAKSYRPISNFTVLSKLLERLVAKQLLLHLDKHKLLPDLESAYRVHHSTETAVLKVLSDILMAIDKGDLTMLVMLDLSAAFGSVDQSILLSRLRISYGLDSTVLYSSGSRRISITAHSSSAVPVPRQLPRLLSLEFHKGRSLDPSSSFSIQLTW